MGGFRFCVFGASKFVPKKPKEKLSGLDGDMQDCPCEKMWVHDADGAAGPGLGRGDSKNFPNRILKVKG